jgi:hypothetical protein
MNPFIIAGCLLVSSWITPSPADVRLPGDQFYAGWTAAGRPARFMKADLFNHIDGGAELFLEFGFAQVDIQRYRRGGDELELEVYDMESPAAALGIYLMNCGREAGFPEIPARNSSEISQATILKGRYFLHINNGQGRPELRPVMTALARAVLEKIPEESPGPILEMLPSEGRVPGSERLVRGPVGLQAFFSFGEGDILKLGGRVFGMLAEFEAPGASNFSRLVIPYPNEREASTAYENLKANLDPYLKITSSGPTTFGFVDFQNKSGRVERRKNVLDFRFKMASAGGPLARSPRLR